MRAVVLRGWALATSALSLALAVLLINGALWLSVRIEPDWLRYRMAGAGFESDITQRIEAAEHDYRQRVVPADVHLCALIGLSGMREGGDLVQLTKLLGGRCRFIGLSGAGGQIDTLAEQTRRLLSGTLRPDVVVIGIAETLLVRPAPPREQAAARWPLLQALRQGDFWGLASQAKASLWFVVRRDDVKGAVEQVLLDWKQNLLTLMKGHATVTRNPLTDPWREMMRMGIPETPLPVTLRREVESFEASGLYAAASYETSRVRPQLEALTTLIRNLRSRGAIVLVALMPEHSLHRSRLPEQAHEALMRGLREAFDAAAPPVLDLRSSVPDEGMADIVHVNGRGRDLINAALAMQIDRLLPRSSPPLMAGR